MIANYSGILLCMYKFYRGKKIGLSVSLKRLRKYLDRCYLARRIAFDYGKFR